MGWFSRKPKKDYLAIENPEDLFEYLIQRKHWKEINPDIIKQIFKNSQNNIFISPFGSIEILKMFIFVSEKYNLVKNNYIRIAKDSSANLGDILGSFASTLYFLGSKLGKACYSCKTVEQLKGFGLSADIAFMLSILCNPFNLSSYYGMAVLHRSFKNKDAGLEACVKYRQAEDMLLNTPDNELTPLQLATKQSLLQNSEERWKDHEKLKKYFPHLYSDDDPFDGMSMRDYIDKLEKELLQL